MFRMGENAYSDGAFSAKDKEVAEFLSGRLFGIEFTL